MHTNILNRCRQTVVLAYLTLINFTSLALADSGDLDPAFGASGIVTTDITPDNDRAQDVVLLTDGSILVAGNGMNGLVLTIVKYLPDGSLDSTFGENGRVVGPAGSGEAMAVQGDGKILVAGYVYTTEAKRYDFLVTRFNRNGILDSTFSEDGIVVTNMGGAENQARAVSIQPDGKILVGGYAGANGAFDFALLRLNSDGSLDTSFSGDGKVTTSVTTGEDRAYDLALQTDGKILLAGHGGTLNDGGLELVRYETNGNLDDTFGSDGIVFLDDITGCLSAYIQPDGKILVAGTARVGVGGAYDFAVARFDVNGNLDPTFSDDGMAFTNLNGDDLGNCMAMDTAGKILVAGYSGGSSDFALVRYNQNGTLDGDFSRDGKIITETEESYDVATGLAVQPNGMVVVAGYSEENGSAFFRVVRYEGHDTDGDGLNDSVETNSGTYLSPTQTGTDPLNPDSDGDGLIDGLEVNRYGSNPLNRDSDGDGFDDGFEVSTGFDPTSNTSVPLTTSIILTAVEFRFLAPAGKVLKIEASTDLQSWYSIENDIAGTGTTLTRFYSVQTIPKRYFRVTEQ